MGGRARWKRPAKTDHRAELYCRSDQERDGPDTAENRRDVLTTIRPSLTDGSRVSLSSRYVDHGSGRAVSTRNSRASEDGSGLEVCRIRHGLRSFSSPDNAGRTVRSVGNVSRADRWLSNDCVAGTIVHIQTVKTGSRRRSVSIRKTRFRVQWRPRDDVSARVPARVAQSRFDIAV